MFFERKISNCRFGKNICYPIQKLFDRSIYFLAYFQCQESWRKLTYIVDSAWLLPDFERALLLFIFICQFIGKRPSMFTINQECCRKPKCFLFITKKNFVWKTSSFCHEYFMAINYMLLKPIVVRIKSYYEI